MVGEKVAVEVTEFGRSHSLKSILMPTLLLLLLVLTGVIVTAYMAINVEQYSSKLLFSVMGLALITMACHRLHRWYSFPLIQIDHAFFVVTRPFLGQQAFRLDRVSQARLFMGALLYLNHNGWPVILNLQGLTRQEREEFVETLCRRGVST